MIPRAEFDPIVPRCPACGARHYPASTYTDDGVRVPVWCDGSPANPIDPTEIRIPDRLPDWI